MSNEKQPIKNSEKDIASDSHSEMELSAVATVETSLVLDNEGSEDWIPREVKWKLFKDEQLTYEDKWRLARSSKGFYELVRHELLKSKAYATCLIPLGLLDNPIFRDFPLDYRLLWDIKKRFKRPESTFKLPFLDDQLTWPLIALCGSEEALEKAVGNEPRQKDLHGFTPLYFIVLRGNLQFAQRWIEKHYLNFSYKDEPQLLLAAMASGNEELAKLLIEKYHYPLNFGIENPEPTETFGWRTLEFGCQTLFWDYVFPNLDQYLPQEYHTSYPGHMAIFGHWNFYHEIIRRGFVVNLETRRLVVCAAARDNKELFMEMVKEFEDERIPEKDFDEENDSFDPETDDYHLFQKYLTLRKAYLFACKGGVIDVVEYFIAGRLIPAADSFDRYIWNINDSSLYSLHATHIAALYGQTDLLHHLFDKYQDEVKQHVIEMDYIFSLITINGEWDKIQDVFNRYLDKHINYLKSQGYILNMIDRLDFDGGPREKALEHGHFYIAQQLTNGGDFSPFSVVRIRSLHGSAHEGSNLALLRWLNAHDQAGAKEYQEWRLRCKQAELEEANQGVNDHEDNTQEERLGSNL